MEAPQADLVPLDDAGQCSVAACPVAAVAATFGPAAAAASAVVLAAPRVPEPGVATAPAVGYGAEVAAASAILVAASVAAVQPAGLVAVPPEPCGSVVVPADWELLWEDHCPSERLRQPEIG